MLTGEAQLNLFRYNTQLGSVPFSRDCTHAVLHLSKQTFYSVRVIGLQESFFGLVKQRCANPLWTRSSRINLQVSSFSVGQRLSDLTNSK